MTPFERFGDWLHRRQRTCRECGGRLGLDDDVSSRLHLACTHAYNDSAAI